jgi:hypothetical protein
VKIKCVFAAFLSLLTLSCAQGLKHSGRNHALADVNDKNCNSAAWGRPEENKENGRLPLRRLETVTWDSVKHELKWDVSRGEKKGAGYEPRTRDRYAINMDKATMTFNGESRRFSEDEAANVRTLMDFVSKYAVESTVWWEDGEGDPVDDHGIPLKPAKPKPGTKPEDKGNDQTVRVVAMPVGAEAPSSSEAFFDRHDRRRE